MLRRRAALWIVEGLSLVRLLGAILFSSVAFHLDTPVWIPVSLYGAAMVSDLLDGYVARKLGVATPLGRALDLVSDKSMTIVSLLYAAARQVDILPLALIAAREVAAIGARLVLVDGTQLLPTNKVFGGAMAMVLWGTTLYLVIERESPVPVGVTVVFWGCAVLFVLNMGIRIVVTRRRISAALDENEEED